MMGSITGIIRNANDVPLEDVNVLIVSGPNHNDVAVITGADGQFSINNIQPGNYVLKAYGQVESDEVPVQVQTEQVPFVEIWLDADVASGTTR
ncbi:carboxypeptidase regulatory-like domain-containing protein [Segetibacter sp. 3557_3]|uniref:carboxypeptidase-like regulatory domain-containing protein n=1 Tax=Segetibacter sp. 3557_3 TaxID=2547429 RepID=UPI001058BBEB|nr:carboxypeptidase-like regulatory domain-containing protein [Segetibacter sp. 3557_3]TDH19955.1 carboxypeptidase regulatory-like domain-containing protein [Segetibacter sp. 3557_3]